LNDAARSVSRRRDLAAIRLQMDRVAALREHRFVRIAGPPGYGKTTLLRAAISAAREAGWLTLSVACSTGARADPAALLLDLTSAALRELGPDSPATRDAGPGPAAIPSEIVVSRLLEAIAADRRLLIAIDDAHAITTETARAIRYVYAYLSDVPLCLICAQRDDAPAHPDLPACSAEVALGPLAQAEACAVVRSEYPGAPDGVVAAIVDQARGSPAELMLLASQARADGTTSASGVSNTLHARTLRELATMDDETRAFLQYCALIGAPVEERILSSLYPDPAHLARLVERSRRYLTATDGAFAFRHDVTAAAIRASIALELPLRRNIIAAFVQPDGGRVEDYQQIVDHAAAIDDRDTCYDYTTRIAQAAYALRGWEQSVSAFAGALALRWPPPERYVTFFRNYAAMLRAANRDAEAEAVIVRALRHGKEIGLTAGMGRLAATLIAIQTELEDPARAIASFDRAIRDEHDPAEVSELWAAIAATYAGTADEPHLDEAGAQIRANPAATALAIASLHQSEALLHARLGRHDAARGALRVAESFSTSQQSGLDFSLPLIELFVDFQEHGCRALDVTATAPSPESRGDGAIGYWHYLHVVADLARGRWRDAQHRLDRLDLERLPPVQQMLLLSVPAAIAALGEDSTGAAARAMPFLDLASRRGIGPSAYQLATWVLAARHDPPPQFANEIVRQVRAFRHRPLAIDLICFAPVALALYAANDDRELAAEIAAQEIPRCSRWLHAQYAFARGYTAAKLGGDGGTALLHDAAERFTALGASFFAELATECAASSGAAPTPQAHSRKRREDGLTAREVQIAELVAAGKRNREIAQALFLSERTIEVHLANAFAKLGITSRTQLARYIMG
jgi:DNA-binding CsgD family transcriptional regulator